MSKEKEKRDTERHRERAGREQENEIRMDTGVCIVQEKSRRPKATGMNTARNLVFFLFSCFILYFQEQERELEEVEEEEEERGWMVVWNKKKTRGRKAKNFFFLDSVERTTR